MGLLLAEALELATGLGLSLGTLGRGLGLALPTALRLGLLLAWSLGNGL